MADKSPGRWRFNWIAGIVLLVVIGPAGAGLSWLHERQLERTATRVLRRAEEAERQVAVARERKDKALLARSLSAAIREYDLYLRYRPGDSHGQLRLALAVSEQAENSPTHAQLQLNAYRVLSRVRARFPENREILQSFGSVAMRLGRWSEALSAWAQLHELEPENVEAALNVARCQIARAQILEAIKTLRACIERHPERLEAYSLLARCYRDEMIRDHESAREVMEKMVANNPQSAAAYARRAAFWLWVSETTSNPQEAREALALAEEDAQAALTEDEKNVDALLVKSELELRASRLSDARKFLLAAEELAPEDHRVWSGLVKWAKLAGDTQVQEKYLTLLAERDATRLPELAEIYLARRPPDLAAARSIVQRMQKAQFDGTTLQLWQLRLALVEGKVYEVRNAATQLFLELSEKNDARAEMAGLTLAAAYLQGGAPDAAGALLSQLREKFPDSPRVKAAWLGWIITQGMTDTVAHELGELAKKQGDLALLSSPELGIAYYLTQLDRVSGRDPDDPDWKRLAEIKEALERSPFLSEEQRLLLRARWLEAQGETNESVQLLEEFVQKNPRTRLLVHLAETLGRSQQVSRALEWLTNAEKHSGLSPELLLAKIRVAEFVEAEKQREILSEVMGKAGHLLPVEQQSVLRQALRFALRQEDADQAVELARRLAVIDPHDLEARRLLLELAASRGDWESAERFLEEIRRNEHGEGRLTAYGQAVIDVARASQRGISAAERQGLLEHAKIQIALGRRFLPFWPDLLRLEARVAQLEGRWNAAIEALQSLHQRGLLGPQGRKELAQLYLLEGQLAEAERVLGSLATEGSKGFEQIKLQAEIWARQGQFGKARQAVALHLAQSKDPLDWLWWAQWLARAQQFAEADAAFQKVRELAPHLPQVVLAEIAYLSRTNRRTEAQQRLQSLEASLKQNTAGYRVLALAYESLGDVDQAEQLFQRALSAAPHDADILLDWAGFCLRRGKWKECQNALERIVSASRDELQVSEETRRNARRNLAQLLARSADYRHFRKACALLEENLKQAPQIVDRCLMARILANRPEKSAKQHAADIYRKVLQDGGTLSTEDRFVYAQVLAQLGRWPDARLQMSLLFQQVSEPTAAQLVFFIRELLAHESPAEEVQPYLEQLTKRVGPDAPIILEFQMRLSPRTGTVKDAEARWRKAFTDALRGKNTEEAGRLAEIAERAGMISWAREAWDELASAFPEATLSKALFEARQKNLEAALDLCERAFSHLPPERVLPEAVNCLRTAREELQPRHLERVAAWFHKVDITQVRDKRTLLAYASFLNLAGEYDALTTIYRRLLGDSSLSELEKALLENNLAYNLAASCDVPRGDSSAQAEITEAINEADELIAHAIDILGPVGSLLDTRAVIRMRQGRMTEAISDARQAVLEEPSPLTYFHLVEALWLSGDKATALREFQRGRENYRLKEESLPPIERPRFRRLLAELRGLGVSAN